MNFAATLIILLVMLFHYSDNPTPKEVKEIQREWRYEVKYKRIYNNKTREYLDIYDRGSIKVYCYHDIPQYQKCFYIITGDDYFRAFHYDHGNDK